MERPLGWDWRDRCTPGLVTDAGVCRYTRWAWQIGRAPRTPLLHRYRVNRAFVALFMPLEVPHERLFSTSCLDRVFEW